MEYNSFYGGRRGASFIITKKYSSIDEMINLFSRGGEYKDVNYDDYVLIDTENKNNPDNGKIYRRGYEYTNEFGGAIYTGQIVGPAGLAPHLTLHTIDTVKEIQQTEGYDYRTGEGRYTTANNSLIPGKVVNPNTGAITYNDDIQWAYCSVRNDNDSDSIAHIGFSFPYPVIDYEVETLPDYEDMTLVRVDDQTHPFYEKWRLSLPKGAKGDSFRNLRTMIADNTIEPYEGQEDDITNHREVVVYDFYTYDEPVGTYKTYYVGYFNKIDNINVTNAGLITIDYSYANTETYQLKLPTNVTIDTGVTEGTGTQKITITYSDGTSSVIGQPLNYIMETAIDSRYHLLAYYSDPARRAALVNPATYNGKSDWADLGYIGNGTGMGAAIGSEDSGAAEIIATAPGYSPWLITEEMIIGE